MQNLILLSLFLFPTFGFSQIKKTNQKVTIEKPKVSPDEQVKVNAEKWFKEFYVEKQFKDPYSFKLLKIESAKINFKTAIQDSIQYLDNEIRNCKISQDERNQETRDGYQKGYDNDMKGIKDAEEKLKTEKDENKIKNYQKVIGIHKKYALLMLDYLREYDLLVLNIKERGRLENSLNSLQPEELDKLSYYKIKLDCYSKNSLGNEVLGRFQFPFTENGPIGKENGLYSVVQLNKE